MAHACLAARHDLEGDIRHQIEEENSCSIDHYAVEKGCLYLLRGDAHHGGAKPADIFIYQHPSYHAE